MFELHGHICGCYYTTRQHDWNALQRHYLPQLDINAHTTVLASVSRTTLNQTFVSPSKTHGIKKLQYTFPLFDGVSIVGFKCTIGDRIIEGEVLENAQAQRTYDEAVARGQTAGLLEQLPAASDVFVTSIGNVPPDSTVLVEITYLGELKHDAEVDGLRLTIPAMIAPRYGSYPGTVTEPGSIRAGNGKFEATVDVNFDKGFCIGEVRSPTHPISVSMGTMSTNKESNPCFNQASATLAMDSSQLAGDFVLQILSKDLSKPRAIVENHSGIPGSRALMATLVPKFQLPRHHPEIVFICDRSGSMTGNKIVALQNALQIFIKSLPLGTVFNICSFGSSHSFLWEKSQPYGRRSVEEATAHVNTFDADYGGTEMYAPLKDTMDRRWPDRSLEIFLVTDGEIWHQQSLFDLINERIQQKKEPIRIFTLGIGSAVSHALIEGVARAADGFSQTVADGERLDRKVVRMLKAATIPPVRDYRLEIRYEKDDDDDFEMIEKVEVVRNPRKTDFPDACEDSKRTISLFDADVDMDKPFDNNVQYLPQVTIPDYLQAPQRIPQLHPFSRTSVYVLLAPNSPHRRPKSVILHGTVGQSKPELEIPVDILDTSGQTIHQLAARKAMLELEEGRGWLREAKAQDGALLKDEHPSQFAEIVQCETVRLGTTFQVGGKHCSFVAVEKTSADTKSAEQQFDFLDDDIASRNKVAEYGKEGLSAVPPPPPAPTSASLFPPAPAPSSSLFKSAAPVSVPGAIDAGVTSPFAPPARRAAPSSPGLETATYFPQPQMSGNSSSGGLFSQSASFGGNTSSGGFFAQSTNTFGGAASGGLFGLSNGGFGCTSTNTGGGLFRSRAPLPAPAAKRARTSQSPDYDYDDDDEVYGRELDCIQEEPAAKRDRSKMKCPSQTSTLLSPLQSLIELQTFEGYWQWSISLFEVIGVQEETAARQLDAHTEKDVLTSLFVVAFLENKLSEEKDCWELIVEKARAWLEGKVGNEEQVQKLLDLAQTLL